MKYFPVGREGKNIDDLGMECWMGIGIDYRWQLKFENMWGKEVATQKVILIGETAVLWKDG